MTNKYRNKTQSYFKDEDAQYNPNNCNYKEVLFTLK